MAQAKRIRRLEFTTGRVIKRNRLVTSKAFKVVAKKMQAVVRKAVGRQGTRKLRSKPGEPPRKQTGFLQGNVKVVAKGRTVFISEPQYGFWLEGGTRNIEPRPHIRVNIHDKRRFWERQFNTAMRRFSK